MGHGDHAIPLHVSVEAKLWNESSAVGVKPMMRLVSRLKHRDFGVFITTSFFDKTVQEELIEDGHPVILVSGGDIARILIANELEEPLSTAGFTASATPSKRTTPSTSLLENRVPAPRVRPFGLPRICGFQQSPGGSRSGPTLGCR